MRPRLDIIERKEEILEWISQNLSNAEISRRLHCKNDTLKKYYKILGISYSGNQSSKGIPSKRRKDALELLENPGVGASRIRRRLIEDGYKENKCECCGLSEWMGRPIPLELHHIDFNHFNNSLDNLQILCSNCHMQAHNYNNNNKNTLVAQ